MRGPVLAATALAFAACASAPPIPGVAPGISFRGGDGSSCQTRIIIRGAANVDAGMAAERQWIRAKFPGYRLKNQSLVDCEDDPTDSVTIVNVAGNERTLYFDISDFFSKEFVPR
jgi:hypothetical protein